MPRPLSELEKAAHEFLFRRHRASEEEARKNTARDTLKEWLTLRTDAGKMPNGDVDDKGNRTLYFDDPLVIGDVCFTGIQAQRKESAPAIDLEAAEELLRAKGEQHYDQVFKRKVVREFDEDALYTLNQKGLVTDDELDDLLKIGEPTYALVAVKG